MSLKLLSVGFALTALTVVVVPSTGFADTHSQYQLRSSNVAQRQAQIARSQAYQDKFQDMQQRRSKHKRSGFQGELVGVPELDPNGLGAAATLLLGGVLVAQGRRRRMLPA